MRTSEVLIRARAKIAVPTRWIKGAIARGKSGRVVEPDGRAAICWCAMGAIDAVANHFDAPRAVVFLRRNIEGGLRIPTFNDSLSTTHEDVLALFDKAIQQAIQEEQVHEDE